MLKRILIASLLLGSITWGQEKIKNICKATHLSPMSVSISCLNGADPTGRKYGDTLIISCARFNDKPDSK